MEPKSFGRFLKSLPAIQVHILCGTIVSLLTIDLINGNAANDQKIGLILGIVAYPVLLGLLWVQHKDDF